MKSRQIVFEIHRLKDEGYSDRAIAKALRIGRNTVARYLKEPQRVMVPRMKVASKLDPYKDEIDAVLKKDASVSASVILRRIQALGYEGQITILRDYLRNKRGQAKYKQAFIRFESGPGQQMQIDWGHFGTISYDDTNRKLYALVVIESYSRMLYVEFTHSQNQQTLHGCLVNAFKAFGGTPQTIVVDNMLTAVSDRQSRVIRFNDAFLDFLRPFHIRPKACNPGAPYEKGKVEAAVKYVRRNFMPLREFKDLEEINAQVLFWLETGRQ